MLKKLLSFCLVSFSLSACSVIGSHSSNNPCEIGSISVISGNNQSATVGESLISPVTVQLFDKCGVAVSNTEIQFSSQDINLDSSANILSQFVSFVSNGFTTHVLSVKTNNIGQASLSIIMPELAGKKSLFVKQEKLDNPVVLEFTANPAPAKKLSITAGNNQSLFAGSDSSNLEVLVTDKFNNPISNVVVAFSSTSGILSNTSAITNSAGLVNTQLHTAQSAQSVQVFATLDPVLNANTVVFDLVVQATEASSLLKISGDGQVGDPETVLSTPIKVRVIDSYGNALGNQVVTFSSNFGSSSVSPTSVSTNALGEAETTITLGSTKGIQVIKASVANGKEALFLATVSGVDNPTDPNGTNITSLKAISGQSQSANVSTSLPSPIKVRVVDSSGNGVSNILVSFYASPAAVLSNPSIVTDSSGYASVNVTLGSISGNYLITATANVSGNNNVNIAAYANAVVGPTPTPTPIPTNVVSLSLVDGSNQSGSINTALPNPIRVKLTDTLGVPQAGKTVKFFVSPSALLGSPTAITNSNGYASTTLTFGSNSGNYIVTATAEVSGNNNVNVTEYAAPPVVAPTPPPLSNINSLQLISGQNQMGDINSLLAQPIKVKIVDSSGAGVSGVDIHFYASPSATFSSNTVTTGSDGTASSNLTLGSVSGNYSISVTANVAGNNNLTVFEYANIVTGPTPDPTPVPLNVQSLQLVSGQNQSGNVNSALTNPIKVKVVDGTGAPVSGKAVKFFVSPFANLSSTTVNTDINGFASVNLTFGSTGGNYIVTVTSDVVGNNNLSITENAIDVVTPTVNVNSLRLVSGQNQTALVGTQLASSIKVQVIDQSGIGVSGKEVKFYTSPSGILSSTSVLTDASGYASTNLTFGSTSGNYVVTASSEVIGNNNLSIAEFATATPVVTVKKIKTLLLMSGFNQSGIVGTALSPLVVKALDENSQPVVGATISFNITGGGGSFNQSSAVTDSSGLGQAIYTLPQAAGTVQGNVSVTADSTVTPVQFSYSASPGAVQTLVLISGGNQTGNVDGYLSSPIVVDSKDQYGNIVPSVTLSLSSSRGDGFIVSGGQVNQVVTNSSGRATFQVILDGTEGARQFNVVATGASLQVSAQGIIPINRPDHLVYISGNYQKNKSSTIVTNPFKVQVIDVSGAGVAGYNVSFSTTNGLFNGTSATYVATTGSDGIATSPLLTLSAVSEDFKVIANTNLPGTPKSIIFNVTSLASGVNDGVPVTSTNSIGSKFNVAPTVAIWDNQNPNKIIFAGNFTSYNGTPNVNRIARVDISGNLDLTFNASNYISTGGFNSAVNSLVQDELGNLYVGGSFTTYNNVNSNYIIRLNNDGTKDSNFVILTGASGGFNSVVNALAYDKVNKLLYAGGSFTSYKTATAQQIARIKTVSPQAGLLDTDFNTSILNLFSLGTVNKIVLDNKNRVMVAGSSGSRILRLNTNGTLDNTFNFGYGFNGEVKDLAIDSFGKVIAVGAFTSYNRFDSLGRIVRLNEDGSIDSNFNNLVGAVGFDAQVNAIKVLPISGKIVLGGAFTSYNSTATSKIAVLSYNGQLDPSFSLGSGFSTGTSISINFLSDFNADRFISLGNFTSYNTYATLSKVAVLQLVDPALGQYQLIVNKNGGGSGTISNGLDILCGSSCQALVSNGSLQVLTALPDSNSQLVSWGGSCSGTIGSVCMLTVTSNTSVSVQFKNVGTTLGSKINPFFNPAFGFTSYSRSNVVRKEGDNVLIGGSFTHYNGYQSQNFIRLLPDGTVDTTLPIGVGFNSSVGDYAKDTDGKYIMVGSFTSYKGVTVNGITKLLPTGVIDTTFNPAASGFNGSPSRVILNSDGTMYVSGSFNTYDTVVANGLIQLNSNGTISSTWKNNTTFVNKNITQILKTSSALYVATDTRVYKLSLNGILDVTFNSGTFNSSINSIRFDQYGKIIVGGSFTSFTDSNAAVSAAKYIARLNIDGSIDQSFTTALQLGFNSYVYDLALQDDGKLLVAGAFTSFNGSTAFALARLNVNGTLDTTFNNNGICQDLLSQCSATVYSITQNSNEVIAVGLFNNYDYFGNSTKAANIAIINRDAVQTSSSAQVLVSIDQTTGNKITDNLSKINCGNGSTTCTALYSAGNVSLSLNLTSDYTFERWEESCFGQPTQTCVLPVVAGGTYSVSARVRYIGVNKPGLLTNSFTTLGGFDGVPSSLVRDGNKSIIMGSFTTYNGTSLSKIVRVDQDGNIDSTFNPPVFDGVVTKVIIRSTSNGNIYYVIGQFRKAGGISVEGVSSLNSDGSLNTSFKFVSSASANFYPSDIILDRDGKLVIVGNISSQSKIFKLNADSGAKDDTFVSAINNWQSTYQGSADIIEDKISGKYYVSNITSIRIIRINNNGSIDNTFTPGSGFNQPVNSIALDSFNKIVIGGPFTSYNGTSVNYFARINNDGSLDKTFFSPLGYGFDYPVNGISLLTNGKLLVWGSFTTYDNTAANYLAVINPDGTIAPDYYGTNSKISSSSIQSITEENGQLFIVGSIYYNNGYTSNVIALNPVAINLPSSYYLSINNTSSNTFATITYNGNVCGTTCLKAFAPGTPVTLTASTTSDVTFLGWDGACSGTSTTCSIVISKNMAVSAKTKNSGSSQENKIDRYFSSVLGFSFAPNWIERSSGTKLLVGTGSSMLYEGILVPYLAQINRDGTLDTTFTSNFSVDGTVNHALLVGSKIFITGSFNVVDGAARHGIAKINLDGTLDTGFTSQLLTNSTGNQLLWDGSDSIYVSGYHLSSDGRVVQKLKISSGAVDSSFSLGVIDYNGSSSVMALSPDGKIYIAYYSYNNTSIRIVRINTNGIIDQTYSGNLGATGTVEGIKLDSFGHVIVYGSFTVSGVVYKNIVRLNSDGLVDSSFLANIGSGADGSVNSVAVMPDGKLIVAGTFYTFNTFVENFILRLNFDGSFDNTFSSMIGTGFDQGVNGMSLGSDGLAVVGSFSKFNSAYAPGIVILSRGNLSVNTATVAVSRIGNGAGSVSGGSISCSSTNTACSQSITIGQSITLTAVPDVGSDFIGWTEGCQTNPTSTTCVVTPSQNTSITAQFRSTLGIANTINTNFRPALGIDAGYIETAVQAETSKVIIGGTFNSYGGQSVKGMTKLLESGAIDSSFINGFDVSNGVEVSNIVKSGTSYFALNKTSRSYSGQPHYGLVKIDGNGTLDSTFLSNFNSISVVQSTQQINNLSVDLNGNLLVTLYSGGIYRMIRVSSSGVLDGSFVQPQFSGPVYDVKFDTSNNLWVRGGFNSLTIASTTTTSSYIVKLTTTGALSKAITGLTYQPNTIAVSQSDASIYIGFPSAQFSYGSPAITVKGLLKLDSSGTTVSSFQTTLNGGFDGAVESIVMDGSKPILAGQFTTLNSAAVPKGIVRLSSSGVADVTLNLGTGVVGSQFMLVPLTSPDRFLLTGSFINLNGFYTAGLVKVQ